MVYGFTEISPGFLTFLIKNWTVYGRLRYFTEVFGWFRSQKLRFRCLRNITEVFGSFCPNAFFILLAQMHFAGEIAFVRSRCLCVFFRGNVPIVAFMEERKGFRGVSMESSQLL